ncbi:DUF935 domain-containing protein [Desulforegula conservatrix]|uniref:DUF935 domain-containing protein n=1 Tax=Desulforegula conservatrix TaxID=153026 RepID=UPI0003F50797|nr:DUF935 domain-containing protein [Desulforegula conservatrix]
MAIFDWLKKKIEPEKLSEEIAIPSVSGIRNPWHPESISQTLTPARLAAILREAAAGDHHAQLELAEEMEERDPHYASVLGVRKRAVSGLEPEVVAASDSAEDVKLADAVRDLSTKPGFTALVDDLMDSLGKGYAVTEIIWNRTKAVWTPERYEWCDPRFFVFDRVTGRELKLMDQSDAFGVSLPPYKFITHIPRLKSGLAVRSGLARLAAATYMCKVWTVSDWMSFAEVFGMPLRIGRYSSAAQPADIRKLVSAVANLGSDAACVIPDSMRIEFQDAARTGGDKLFLTLAEWLDRQMSKAVLGQTMTSDDGSSQAQAKVHNEVRIDILRADANQLEETLNRDLVIPFIILNFGEKEKYPRLTLPVREAEDINTMAEALAKLVPLGGLGIEASQVRDRLGFADPAPGAVLLGDIKPEKAANRENLDVGGLCRASQAQRDLQQGVPLQADAIDEMVIDGLAEWKKMDGPANAVLELAGQCGSFDEFLAGLPGIAEKAGSQKLFEDLARRAFEARGKGYAEGLS